LRRSQKLVPEKVMPDVHNIEKPVPEITSSESFECPLKSEIALIREHIF
jgi:hypothetical protein